MGSADHRLLSCHGLRISVPGRLLETFRRVGGFIAAAENDAYTPKSLKYAVIGPLTATEIRLID